MNKAKLLFDECVGHPLVTQLGGVIGVEHQDVELSHVIWKNFGGINDDVWIPQIAAEGWIIITGDDGKKKTRGKGEKLPLVCAEHKVTYVSLSRTVGQFNSFDKYRTILNHWSDLVALKDAPRGSGYQIRQHTNGHTIFVLKRPIEQPHDEQKQ